MPDRWVDPLTDDEVPDPFLAALVAVGDGEVPDVLRTLLARPEWHQEAVCRGMGTDLFFLAPGGDSEPGKAICATCPVQAECLEAGQGEHGLWGGLGAKQRRQIR